MEKLEQILKAVAGGGLSPGEAAERLRTGEVRYLEEFAALDTGRAARKGVPEVIYAPGKTPEQVARICETLLESAGRIIVSGPTPGHEAELRRLLPGVESSRAGRSLVLGPGEPELSGGRVAAISAGTSDLPMLEEAVAVAQEMGVAVKSFHDIGVAGIHRLSGPIEEVRSFDPDCLIVAAGMEGALPTVVSALVAVPVIGLPTSTGYGLGGDGTAAILGMLQSCSPGLSVVNVDNGVGAGATAALVANRAARRASGPGSLMRAFHRDLSRRPKSGKRRSRRPAGYLSPAECAGPDPSNVHLTLKFLGDAPEDRLPRVREALETVCGRRGPFGVQTLGLRRFSLRGARPCPVGRGRRGLRGASLPLYRP